MRRIWWELIFALVSLTASLLMLRIEGITPVDWKWWVIIAGFAAWNSLSDYFLEDLKEWVTNHAPKTAEWIEPTNGADSPKEWRECSRCGNSIDVTFSSPLPKYCEECGRKMKNGGETLDNPRP